MHNAALWSLADLRQLEDAAALRGIRLMPQAAQATVDWVEQHVTMVRAFWWPPVPAITAAMHWWLPCC
jgi:hypothetical protein